MDSINLSTHLRNGVKIVRTHTIIIWFLGLTGLMNSINTLFPGNPLKGILIALSIMIAIVATPVIYGIYYEIIKDTYSSPLAIGKKYVPSYILLLLRMYVPVIFFAALPVLSSPDTIPAGYFQMIIITFSLLYLYIIPLFYVQGSQQGVIGRGITFLTGNLFSSAPLILLSLLTETALIIFELKKGWFLAQSKLYYAVAEFCIYLGANLIDFVLFIAMIFVLEEFIKTSQTSHQI